jgi:hypothetical protein
MRIPRAAHAAPWLLSATLLLASCSKQELHGLHVPNLAPTVELSQVPVPADTAGTYVYEVSWAGFDPDGRIARFQYTVDPPSITGAETSWVATSANRATFVFRADSVGSGGATRSRGFHTVAVVAVDDAGARSAVATASFTATTVAPVVRVVSPPPSPLLEPQLPSSIRISWTGEDPDGVPSRVPASYRWKLLRDGGEFPRLAAILDPDSLRRRYAPDFAGWDSVSGDVESATLTNLIPGQRYTFVVVAFDRAGAYSPAFTFTGNMLNFVVGARVSSGPVLTLSNPVFSYTYASGGVSTDPDTYIRIEYPADVPIPFEWSGRPGAGSVVTGYRWAVDVRSLDDENPRTDEQTDLAHWSRWTTGTSLTLPPVSPAAPQSTETHLLFLEAVDDLGLMSLAIVQYTVVRPRFDKDLLVVDDTWFTPDRTAAGGCVAAPGGIWPTAAELDSLMYAVGNKPYRCYPTGTRSTPGLLAGYAFDTLATHLRPPGTLSVQLLGRYRHVIWMCDLTSSLNYGENPYTQARPMPLLRELSSSAVQNPLRTWLLQGGRMWLMGGGAAYASLRDHDAAKSPNNVFANSLGELVQGRLMYDSAHWRSELTVLFSVRATRSARAVGGWPGAPDYSQLPPELAEHSVLTDPLPPLRANLSWPASYGAEYLTKPNSIIEFDPPIPGVGVAYSALDTLYETLGGQAGSGHPVMTLYHGADDNLFVFSGFPLWYFSRAHAIPLVDFVLQRIWGLTRRPVAR